MRQARTPMREGAEQSAAPPRALLRLNEHGLANVLIVGGGAAERGEVARIFHRQSALAAGPLVRFDASGPEEPLLRSLWGWLGVGAADPVQHPLRHAARGTLFIDHVTSLSEQAQRMLLALMRRGEDGAESEAWCGRLIAGCAEDPEEVVARGGFSYELLDGLDKIRVRVASAPIACGPRGGAPRRRASLVRAQRRVRRGSIGGR